jgi:NSS family neurotransmitter:Na+ symporter
MSIFIASKWKTKNLSEEISSGNPNYKGSLIEKLLNIAITVVCPIILGVIFLITFMSKFLNIDFGFI